MNGRTPSSASSYSSAGSAGSATRRQPSQHWSPGWHALPLKPTIRMTTTTTWSYPNETWSLALTRKPFSNSVRGRASPCATILIQCRTRCRNYNFNRSKTRQGRTCPNGTNILPHHSQLCLALRCHTHCITLPSALTWTSLHFLESLESDNPLERLGSVAFSGPRRSAAHVAMCPRISVHVDTSIGARAHQFKLVVSWLLGYVSILCLCVCLFFSFFF